MRKILLVVSSLFLLVGAAHAETRIGYVDTARVLNEAPQMQEIRDRLKSEFKDEEEAIQKKQNELLELQEKAKSQGENMSDAERKKLQEQFLKLRGEFSKLLQDYKEKASARQQEEFSRFDNVVKREIQQFAQQEGYDLILTDGVAFANSSIDVTDKVIARIKAAAASESGN